MHGDGHAEPRVRIAAAGDLHCRETRRREIEAAFARIAGEVDAILLAGDLTTHGAPDQAAILADACAPLEVPVVTVLGNHDWHANRTVEVVETLTAGGITVLDRSATVLCLGGLLGQPGLPGAAGPEQGDEARRREIGADGLDVGFPADEGGELLQLQR